MYDSDQSVVLTEVPRVIDAIRSSMQPRELVILGQARLASLHAASEAVDSPIYTTHP